MSNYGDGAHSNTGNYYSIFIILLWSIFKNTHCLYNYDLWISFSYQGEIGAYLVLGGVDSTGPHLFTIHAHGSTDKLPYVSMGENYNYYNFN